MKCVWRNRQGNRELLIFFHGWSMDEAVPMPACGDLDVLIACDYTTLLDAPPVRQLAGEYDALYLVGWSLGVFAAASALKECGEFFADTLAINGTLEPVSAETGIAPEIFSGTAENWLDPAARRKFQCRMGSGAPMAEHRTPEDQQRELRSLQRFALLAMPDGKLFRRSVIGSRDRIFPPEAQRNAWRRAGIQAVELPLPHYPFAGLNTFREVLHLGRHR